MQPLSGNQRPDLLTSLMNMSFVLRLPRKMRLCRSFSNVPCLPSFLEMLFCSLLKRCTIPCACHAKRHLNLQKWSEPLVFWTFWLRNVLRATTACTFLTSQLQKVVRPWCVLCILSWCSAPQRRAIFHLSSGQLAPHPPLYRAYFSTLPSQQSLEKTQCFATFLPFRASASSFFWLFLCYSSLCLCPTLSAFHLSILSEVWLLDFLRTCVRTVWYWVSSCASSLGSTSLLTMCSIFNRSALTSRHWSTSARFLLHLSAKAP